MSLKKKFAEYILWLLLLLPLVLVYIESTADWGDDFAIYIEEAQHIIQHRPFYLTHFKFFDYNNHYAPPYYTVGYPVLLAPVLSWVGLDMRLLNLYMSCWVLCWGLLTIYFVRRYYSIAVVAFFMIAYFLNPYFFECKGRVLSDVPFSFFFLLTIVGYTAHRQGIYRWIGIGLCMAIAISIRTIGVVLAVGIGIDVMRSMIYQSPTATWRDRLYPLGVIYSSALALLLLVYLLFPAPPSTYYIQQFGTVSGATIIANMKTYPLLLFNFFATTEQHPYGTFFFAWFMLIVFGIGMIGNSKPPKKFLQGLLISFMIVLFIFPDTQGFRYLLPIVPVLLYMSMNAISSIYLPASIRSWIAGTLVIVVLFLYTPAIALMVSHRNRVCTYGPFTPTSQHGFETLKKLLPDTALVACVSPRVVALLSSHYCCILPEGTTAQQLRLFPLSHPTYLLAILERDCEKIDAIAIAHADSMIWQQDGFRLYRCKPWK